MAFVMVMILALTVPAHAATEYGHYYDETELLYSEELETLGLETLPGFLETYDIDLRVDILTGIGELADVSEAAGYLYEEYSYGGSEGNGASLTILVHEDDDGIALDEWVAYFDGDSDEWMTNGPWNISEVYEIMTEENWSGNLEQDIQTLTDAVSAMVNGLEDFILAGGVADSIWSPVTEGHVPHSKLPEDSDATTAATTTAAATQAPSTTAAKPSAPDVSEAQLDNITDATGCLTDEQWQALELQAREISGQYNVGVYAIAVDDYLDYTDGTIYDAADALYHGYTLGLGEDRDGILLLLSMEDRDYILIAYGDNAKYAFSEGGRAYLTEFFLDDFGNDSWYEGFRDYLSWSGNYLENAKNGQPYSYDHVPMSNSDRLVGIAIRVAVILLVPLLVAGIYIMVLSAKMKSVEIAEEASNYMSGELNLTEKSDIYSHTTQSRSKVEDDDDRSGSSSGSSSGGGSGTSGKF